MEQQQELQQQQEQKQEQELLLRSLLETPGDAGTAELWSVVALKSALADQGLQCSQRTLERKLADHGTVPACLHLDQVRDELGRPLKASVSGELVDHAQRKRLPILMLQVVQREDSHLYFVNDRRLGRRWSLLKGQATAASLQGFLATLVNHYRKDLLIWPHNQAAALARELVGRQGTQRLKQPAGWSATLGLSAYPDALIPADHTAASTATSLASTSKPATLNREEKSTMEMTHLDRLEAESIHIIREVMAEAENPVMLYSIGKDSAVMLRLAEKAFYPSKPPFPLLHVDTRWKFQAMYAFRDRIAEQTGMDLIVHINPEGVEKNINPFDHGSALHTDVMKTQSLKMALDKYKFDVAFGGARRDEEKSRAKERVFSFRTSSHRWDPKNQRPELWNLYNGRKNRGESIRVFPLSNWTELDIWEYIYRENIPIVPLYFAAERPVIERDGMLMMVDDDRLQLYPGEKIQHRKVRFRTLGCYPLTGAVESEADDLPKILLELLEARTSERQGRAIDSDSAGSMEKKKQEGYF